MFSMDFPDESFDIIWAEGSIHIVGFKKGLNEWKRYLKPGGYMVVHDEQGNINEKLALISDCSYEIIGHFMLSQDTWRTEYFDPLEKLVNEFQLKLTGDHKAAEELQQAQDELKMFQQNKLRNSSVYFILKRQP